VRPEGIGAFEIKHPIKVRENMGVKSAKIIDDVVAKFGDVAESSNRGALTDIVPSLLVIAEILMKLI